jgi:hypothetical protein
MGCFNSFLEIPLPVYQNSGQPNGCGGVPGAHAWEAGLATLAGQQWSNRLRPMV